MASNIIRDNIVKDGTTGELYIPASKRPDGTWRKPIKVKDGYIPQDEVPIYESKAIKASKQKELAPKKGPPGAVFVDDLEKEKKQKKKNEPSTAEVTKMVSEIKISNKITPEQIEADLKQKQIRKLRKTIREIEQLEERIKSGELKAPEKDQLEKIKKKESFVKELESLGEEVD